MRTAVGQVASVVEAGIHELADVSVVVGAGADADYAHASRESMSLRAE